MKLLLENWREFLDEGMKGLDDIPEDFYIQILEGEHGRPYIIRLMQRAEHHEHGDEVGRSVVEEVDSERIFGEAADERKRLMTGFQAREGEEAANELEETCEDEYYDIYQNLYTMHVFVDEDFRGWGPLLTDIAMELADEDGKWIVPAKLVGGAGTEGAKRIYDFYLKNRSDVVHEEIDRSCWGYFTGDNLYDVEEESFKYLYRKDPKWLVHGKAKVKIKRK